MAHTRVGGEEGMIYSRAGAVSKEIRASEERGIGGQSGPPVSGDW